MSAGGAGPSEARSPAPHGVVLAGGPLTPTDRLRGLVAGAALVVAADGGLAHAAPLALRPDLIVGDFDSVAADDLARFGDVPQQRHPRAKNQLDLELALDVVGERGLRRVVVAGGLGGRLDQTLAAVLIAARRRRLGTDLVLGNGVQEVWPLAAGDERDLRLPPGTVFSVSSLLEGAVLDVEEAAFPLSMATLPFGVGRGVSNVAAGGPVVRVHAGLVLVTVEWCAPSP